MTLIRTWRCDGCRRVVRGAKPKEWFELSIKRVGRATASLFDLESSTQAVRLDVCSDACIEAAICEASVIAAARELEVGV